jgi:hypothetical protein
MRRIDHATAIAGLFTDGEVATQVPPTRLNAQWCNDVQEEIARAIELSGLTLSSSREQLFAAMLAQKQGAITPAQITADVDDYAPTGHSTAALVLLDSNSSNNDISGWSASASVLLKTLVNIGSAPIRIEHENAGSVAANRFICPDSVDYILAPGEAVAIYYHGGSVNRWRVLGFAPNKTYTLTGVLLEAESIIANSGISTSGALTAGSFSRSPALAVTRYWPATHGHCLNFSGDFAPTTNPGDVSKQAASSNTWVMPLNGLIPDDASIDAVMLKWSRTTGDDVVFSLYSTDLFGGDPITHETVTISATGASQTQTLPVAPEVDFSPSTRLYYLLAAQTSTASNLVLHSFGASYEQGDVYPS